MGPKNYEFALQLFFFPKLMVRKSQTKIVVSSIPPKNKIFFMISVLKVKNGSSQENKDTLKTILIRDYFKQQRVFF